MPAMKNKKMEEVFSIREERLRADLKQANAVCHSVHKGDISETTWIKLLCESLPGRYCVGSGVVIDADGEVSDQIDCIIYDAVYTPKIFGEDKFIHIPAESVHAVVEIKTRITPEDIKYASEKAESVRRLTRTSGYYIGDGEPKPPKPFFPIIGGLMALECKAAGGLKTDGMKNVLKECSQGSPLRIIDFVLTAENGYAYFDKGHPVDEPHIGSKGRMMEGVFKLLIALQTQGTVPAVNWWHYLK